MVLHYSGREIDSGAGGAARMKNLKPDTPIILLFGGADEPVEEVPVVDVFVRKLASPNILLDPRGETGGTP